MAIGKRRGNFLFRTKFGKFMLFVGFLLLLYPMTKVYQIYIKNKQMQAVNESVEKEVLDLEEKKKFLQAQITRLKTEEGKEEEARKKFNISRPDEELLIITEKKETKVGEQEEGEGFFGDFWREVKSIF